MSSPIKTPKRIRSTNHQATTRSPTATAPLLSWRNALLSGFRAKPCPRTFFFQVQSGTNHASYTTIRLISHHPRVFCLTFKGLTLVFWSGVFMGPKKEEEGSAMVFKKSSSRWITLETPWKFYCEFVSETLSTIYQWKVIWHQPKTGLTIFQANHEKITEHFELFDIPKKRQFDDPDCIRAEVDGARVARHLFFDPKPHSIRKPTDRCFFTSGKKKLAKESSSCMMFVWYSWYLFDTPQKIFDKLLSTSIFSAFFQAASNPSQKKLRRRRPAFWDPGLWCTQRHLAANGLGRLGGGKTMLASGIPHWVGRSLFRGELCCETF